MPKSVTFTRPSGCTSTLPGFTSRCTSPRAWATEQRVGDLVGDAAAVGDGERAVAVDELAQGDARGPAPSRCTRRRRPRRCRRCATMFGWVTAAAVTASRRNRARIALVACRSRGRASSPRRGGRAAGRRPPRPCPSRRGRSRVRAGSGRRGRVRVRGVPACARHATRARRVPLDGASRGFVARAATERRPSRRRSCAVPRGCR